MGGVRASLWRMIAIAITSLRDLGDVIVGPGVVAQGARASGGTSASQVLGTSMLPARWLMDGDGGGGLVVGADRKREG